jgi:EmrB/QacA subfamily drug resistance transporter
MTPRVRATNATPAGELTDAQKRKIVAGVMLAMFLATLDQTIVAPALPTIGKSLGDAEFLPWIVSAYLLTSTAVTPLYGKLSDIHGRRPVLTLALGVFLFGSTLCALSTGMAALIAGRALQGLGGGGLVTLAQTVVGDIASPRERAKYVVFISTVWATSSVAGPVLGGFFAQHLSWTVIFWINLPLGALAIFISGRALRGAPQVRRQHRLDGLGAALIIAASVGLMLALTLAGLGTSWLSPSMVALTAASLVLSVWFVAHLQRAPEPLIPIGVFENGVVGKATAAIFFSMFAFVGGAVYLPIYFQIFMKADATLAGAGLIVLLGGSVISANIAGRYMPRLVHYKRMALVGLCLAIAAQLGFAALASRLDFWSAEVLAFALGIGLGPLFPTATIAVQNAVDQRDLGIATATLAFLRTFGGAIGVALLGAIVTAYDVVGAAGALDAAFAERAGAAFHAVFALQAFALAISLACLALMEERPLRGPSRSPAAPQH